MAEAGHEIFIEFTDGLRCGGKEGGTPPGAVSRAPERLLADGRSLARLMRHVARGVSQNLGGAPGSVASAEDEFGDRVLESPLPGLGFAARTRSVIPACRFILPTLFVLSKKTFPRQI